MTADRRAGFDPDESPLARLATRKGANGAPFLSGAEAMAGERLRADWTRACLLPGVTQRWDAPSRGEGCAGGAGDLSDAALDARRRVHAALDAIGPELAGVVSDVCCFLKGLETVERERRWPVRSAKLLLKAGLGALARHYGTQSGQATSARVRGWRARPG